MQAIICTLLLVVLLAKGNIVSVSATIWPTAASNTDITRFSLFTKVTILEDYTEIAPKFYTVLLLSETGFFESTDPYSVPADIRVNDYPFAENMVGYNEYDGSTASLNKMVPFTKSTVLSIQLDNLRIVKKNYKNLRLTIALLRTTSDVVLMKRIHIPFHFDSGIWSSTDKSIVSLRFMSASGYQPSAFIEFKLPQCVPMNNTSGPILCSSIPWIVPTRGFSRDFTCSVSNDKLTIANINGMYPYTNATSIEFSIVMSSPHACKDTDYAYATLIGTYKKNELEKVVLAGINGRPVPWVPLPLPEEPKKVSDYAQNVGICTALLTCLIVVLI